MRWLSVLLALTGLACGGGPTAPPAPAPSAAPASAAAPTTIPATVAPSAPAAWTPPPIGACETEALLATYSFHDLQTGGYCRVCKGVDVHACELDWPTSDVPDCGLWDEMRNGIYAYYGRPFENEKWARMFAQRAWYHPDPTYTDARLSAVAVANVALLKDMREKKTMCEVYGTK